MAYLSGRLKQEMIPPPRLCDNGEMALPIAFASEYENPTDVFRSKIIKNENPFDTGFVKMSEGDLVKSLVDKLAPAYSQTTVPDPVYTAENTAREFSKEIIKKSALETAYASYDGSILFGNSSNNTSISLTTAYNNFYADYGTSSSATASITAVYSSATGGIRILSSPYVNEGEIIVVNGTSSSTTISYNSPVYDVVSGSITMPEYYVTYDGVVGVDQNEFKKQNFKQQMKSNLLIKTGVRGGLNLNVSPAELKARMTLRDMISEADWRRYVTNGFIIHKGQKRWYQIFNDRRRIKVYESGELIAEICVHSDDSVPKTDHVINMITLIQFDEDAFYRFGNVSWFGKYSKNNKWEFADNVALNITGNIVVGNIAAIGA